MYFGNVSKACLEIDCKYQKIINEVKELDWGVSSGRYDLTSIDGAFVLFVDTHTLDFQDCLAESHKRYTDIQVLIKGMEKIGFGIEPPLTMGSVFDNDVEKYSNIPGEQFVELQPGDFAIFCPPQPHRPLVAVGEPMQIRKAIVKIPN